MGRSEGEFGPKITSDIASWVPWFERQLALGNLKTIEFETVNGTGWEKVIEGIKLLESGKASKKILVRV
jgi:hypothetical protein